MLKLENRVFKTAKKVIGDISRFKLYQKVTLLFTLLPVIFDFSAVNFSALILAHFEKSERDNERNLIKINGSLFQI